MWYWIVMILLIAGSICMLGISFAAIRRQNDMAVRVSPNTRRRGYDEDEDYDEDRPRNRSGRRADEYPQEAPRQPQRKKRRQWKIILEDIDSWEKYSFTFYDTVGIGRGKDGGMYEKYLPVLNDGRVSKIHCVIVHRGDRLYLKDEGSRNGTYLNGTRINQPVVIQRDDIIGVGETRLEIQRILRESE